MFRVTPTVHRLASKGYAALVRPVFAAWTPRLGQGVPGVKKRRQALNSQRRDLRTPLGDHEEQALVTRVKEALAVRFQSVDFRVVRLQRDAP